MARRILRKLKLFEISGVDRPCQEGAQVTIMKRADDSADVLVRADTVLALAKFDPNQPRDEDGKWSESGGGGGRASADGGRTSQPGNGSATPQQKSRLRRVISALRSAGRRAGQVLRTIVGTALVVSVASRALVAYHTTQSFAARQRPRTREPMRAPPGPKVSPQFNWTPAEREVWDRLEGAPAWAALMRRASGAYRKPPMSKGADELTDQQAAMLLDALPDLLTADEASQLEAAFPQHTKQETEMNTVEKSGYGDSFDALRDDLIAKGYPVAVAGQVVLQKYGPSPDAAPIRKSESNAADFMALVDATQIAKGCSRRDAMAITRKSHPREFDQFQEA